MWRGFGVVVGLLAASSVAGQALPDGLPFDLLTSDEAAAVQRVAGVFPHPWLTQFRKIRRVSPEAAAETTLCGQVSATDVNGETSGFQLFLYTRTAGGEQVRILGSDALNGYRVGRKMIAALKRAGCL